VLEEVCWKKNNKHSRTTEAQWQEMYSKTSGVPLFSPCLCGSIKNKIVQALAKEQQAQIGWSK
jgi:hypothetical protein